MAAPPYMKLYVADYLGDTHHLSAIEHGAYMLLLMGMWRAGGSLPASDLNLSRLARCTPEEWGAVKLAVLPFFKRSRGKLTHKRVTAEMAKYENTSRHRSEAGKAGAAKKANKDSQQAQANADRLPTKPEPEPEPEPERIDVVEERAERVDDWPEGKAVDHAATLIAEACTVHLDPSRSLSLVTTTGRLEAWRRDGASWEHDVRPTVLALAAKTRRPIASWKFFDAAIAQSIADNAAALQIPNQSPRHDPPRSAKSDHLAAILGAMAVSDEFRSERGGGGGSAPKYGPDGRMLALPPAA